MTARQEGGNRISNIKLRAGDEPIHYYFIEADGLDNIRAGERRSDLPEGKLEKDQEFRYNDTAYASRGKSICIMARKGTGELIAAACDANGVLMDHKKLPKSSLAPVGRRRTKIGTMKEIQDRENYAFRRMFSQPMPTASPSLPELVEKPPTNKWDWLVLLILLFFIFLIVRSIYKSFSTDL